MKLFLVCLLLNVLTFDVAGQSVAVHAPFKVTIKADPGTVKPGSEVAVGVTVTNISGRDIEYPPAYNYAIAMSDWDQYDIRDRDGNPVQENAISKDSVIRNGAPAIVIKPGESQFVGSDLLNILYNLTQPGEYTVQLLRTVSRNPEDGVVKSNKITVTVTNDESAADKSLPPFTLQIDAYSDGVGSQNGHLTVKTGAEVGIHIVKTNTSKHPIDCSTTPNRETGLDDEYQYDVRDRSGNQVGKRVIEAPLMMDTGPSKKICKAEETRVSDGDNTITRVYDLSVPGVYKIQVSQPFPDNPAEAVKSNTITVKVMP